MSTRHIKGSPATPFSFGESMHQAIRQAFVVSDTTVWDTIIGATCGEMSPLAADILDVSRALFLADCQQKRPSSWRRLIPITLTVREPVRWEQTEVVNALTNALKAVSGDDYAIKIVGGSVPGAEVLPRLRFDMPYRVCLFSDGLDSLCGLTLRVIQEHTTPFFAVSGLTQRQAEGHIKKSVADLNQLLGNQVVSVPISLYRHRNRQRAGEEPSQRSRSILLLMLGTVVALMAGHDRVEVFENGIEVFNFPLTLCQEPERLSRAMHPFVLERMSTFVSALIGTPFNFIAPFTFHTKTEMLRAISEHLPAEYVEQTHSCIRYRSEPCGYCLGCVLRQLALFHNNMIEPASIYRFNIFSGKRGQWVKTAQETLEKPLYTMNTGIYYLNKALGDAQPFRALMKLSGLHHYEWDEFFSATARVSGTPETKVKEHLNDLYRRYAKEWADMRPHVQTLPPFGGVSINSKLKEGK